jgi:hypothetical protein
MSGYWGEDYGFVEGDTVDMSWASARIIEIDP